ncbi:MAG: hypothetical protein JOZ49_08580 [Mycolicibacterium sp.]|nr:hypothetical protein [Mycolicibacterium sp.]
MKINYLIGGTVLAGALGIVVISPVAAYADPPPPPSPPAEPLQPPPPPEPWQGGPPPAGQQLPGAALSMLDPASLAWLSGLLPLIPRGSP